MGSRIIIIDNTEIRISIKIIKNDIHIIMSINDMDKKSFDILLDWTNTIKNIQPIKDTYNVMPGLPKYIFKNLYISESTTDNGIEMKIDYDDYMEMNES